VSGLVAFKERGKSGIASHFLKSERASDLRFRRSDALCCSRDWIRTSNRPINSRMLCR
jgi:hypothetical protein